MTKHFSYDSLGNLVSAELNCCQQKQWNFSFSTQYAFPDSVVSGALGGPQLTTSATYYLATGQIATATDENGKLTIFTYADAGHLDRVTDMQRPDNVHVTTSYDDVQRTLTVTSPIQSTNAVQRITAFDLLGRPLTNAIEDANNNVYSTVKTQYDVLGRPYKVSNPYTGLPQFFTTNQFDALGRVTAVILPDGAQTTSSYVTNSVIVTDPASKPRKSLTDGLGRLVEVDEPGGPDPGVQATTSVTISGAFNSTWVGAGTPHLAAAGTAIASVTLSDGSSHDFYFDTHQHLCQMSWISGSGWFDQDLTSMTESSLPSAGSSIAAVALGGVIHVFYQGANQHIYDMNWTGSIWQNLDMTVLTGASPVSNTKMAVVDTGSPNTPMMFYEGTNQHLFCVYWSSPTTAWSNADLHSLSGATNLIAPNGAISAAMWGTTGNIHALFLDTNQNLNRIVWSGTAWITNNLTSITGAALAVPGSKLTTISTGTPIDLMTFYEGAGQHIYSIYWNNSAGTYQTLDFTVWSGATNIAAVLTSLTNNPVGPHMFYLSSNQHLDDMLWNGSAWVNADLTALANTTAVPASGSSLSSHGTSGGNTYNIFFEGGNQHIYHTYFSPSASAWFNEDPLVAASNFVVDSGTVSVTIPNGGSNFTATVCYGASTNPICAGQAVNASPGAIASALAAVLNGAGSPVNASSSGATLSLTWRATGVVTTTVAAMTSTSDYPAVFPNGSFTSTSGTFSGGVAPSNQSLRNPFITNYTYGVLDNLLQVTQGAQTRIYAYDGMGRVTDATTPEAGHINFQYNSFSQISQQTDARGVKANYGYDTLNRLHQLSYDVGQTGVPPSATAIYNFGTDITQNNNGRLLSVTDGLGSETYTYDLLGRTTQVKKIINGTTYNIGYAYNLAGGLTSLTYPSSRVVQQSFDAIGRLCEIAPQTAACANAAAPYATGYTYNAASAITGFNYGNGVSAVFSVSQDRLQVTGISYAKGTQTLLGLNYLYKQDPTNCPMGAAGNNGQIQCITDTVESGRSISYTYDTLGRLGAATTAGSPNYPAWGLSFTYDRYGNRTGQNVTVGSGFPVSTPIDPTTNRINIAPYNYDASGNLLNDGNNTMVYDAANRAISSTALSVTSNYSYDCKGLRVQKVSSGTTTVYIYSGGKVIAEYVNGAAASAPARQYIYAGSSLLAKIEAGTTNFYHADHLSTRMATDANGGVAGQQGLYPFGDPWYDIAITSNRKLGNYERDAESGNDYAMARTYVNRIGRFSSADSWGGSMSSPQTHNLNSYVANDPVNLSDPTGHFISPLLWNLYRLFPTGFGSNWDEFFFLENPVQVGTGYLFNGNKNFRFEDFNHNELMNFADQGEIRFLGSIPIYSYLLVNPAPPPGLTHKEIFRQAEDEALRRLANPKCASAFKGKGAAQIKNTNYREKNWNYTPGLAQVGPQGWSMATETSTDVAINRQGDFYNLGPPDGVVNDPTTGKTYTLAPGAELDAFEILHELTHQLNLGVNDYQNPLGQQANNLYVLQNCW